MTEAATEFGSPKKTLTAYVVGLILSLILTIAAFSLVQAYWHTSIDMYVVLAFLAIMQFVVQAVCFLRLSGETAEERWHLLPFLFAVLIVAILVGGTAWIMFTMNYNMMN